MQSASLNGLLRTAASLLHAFVSMIVSLLTFGFGAAAERHSGAQLRRKSGNGYQPAPQSKWKTPPAAAKSSAPAREQLPAFADGGIGVSTIIY